MSNTLDDGDTAFVTVLALDMNDGFKERGRIDTCVVLDPYATEKIDVSTLMTSENILLVSDVMCGENTYRSYFKKGKLKIVRDDSFEVESLTEYTITVRAKKYLQAVELEGDYTFSDNYFTMLEGEEKTVTFKKFSDKANGVTVKSYTLK